MPSLIGTVRFYDMRAMDSALRKQFKDQIKDSFSTPDTIQPEETDTVYITRTVIAFWRTARPEPQPYGFVTVRRGTIVGVRSHIKGLGKWMLKELKLPIMISARNPKMVVCAIAAGYRPTGYIESFYNKAKERMTTLTKWHYVQRPD